MCRIGFVPESVETYMEDEVKVPIAAPPLSPAEWLADTGAVFIRLAIVFLVAAPFLGLPLNAMLDTAASAKLFIRASAASGCVSGAVSLAVLGNLLHIRALLEKKRR